MTASQPSQPLSSRTAVSPGLVAQTAALMQPLEAPPPLPPAAAAQAEDDGELVKFIGTLLSPMHRDEESACTRAMLNCGEGGVLMVTVPDEVLGDAKEGDRLRVRGRWGTDGVYGKRLLAREVGGAEAEAGEQGGPLTARQMEEMITTLKGAAAARDL